MFARIKNWLFTKKQEIAQPQPTQPPQPYQFRNLPCRVNGKQMPWIVGGICNFSATEIGAGILEWCYDQNDANTLANLMRQDSRFKEIKVREYN